MGAALTAQMATAKSLILDPPPVAHETPPPTPEAPLASGLDADHIAALHAQAVGLHNIRFLVSIVLDPASSQTPTTLVGRVRSSSLFDDMLSSTTSPTTSSLRRLRPGT